MSVQIIINGDTAAESLKELTTLAAGFGGSTNTTTKTEEAPKRQSRSTKSVKEEPVVEDKPDTTPEPQDDPVDDDLSFDEIPDDVKLRATASEKANSVGKVKVKALLDKYGVPNVTALPNEKRVAFLKELEGLA